MAVVKQLFNKRMLLMLLGCLLVFGGIFAFKLFGKHMMNQAFDNMPLPPATITSAEVQQQSWQTQLQAVGSLRAVNGVQVTTQAQGEVKAIHFESGQSVSKGDLLIELAAAPESAQVEVLQAELRLAKRSHDRIKTLRASGVATQAEMDEVQSTLDRILANILVQRATIEERNIRAPFSGQLGIREVDLGQNVAPGDAVVSLQQLQPIYVDFALSERDFSRVHQGLRIDLSAGAFPDQTFSGQITAINPAIDPRSRTFQLQATLKNSDRKLHPGMFADVTVAVKNERRVLVVPRTAISFAPYGNSVFVLQQAERKNNDQKAGSHKTGDQKTEDALAKGKQGNSPGLIAVKRFVKTGEVRGDLIEITEGLRAGEQIATSGLLKLRNEGSVIINNGNPPPEKLNPIPENS